MDPVSLYANNLPGQTPTIEIYNKIAQNYVQRTLNADMSAFYNDLSTRFPAGARLLDVGSGSGRDALALASRGFFVDILEPSHALLSDFQQRAPDFRGRAYGATVAEADLPLSYYDGAYACASLLHVAPSDWAVTLQALRATVTPGGKLFVSVKQMESGFDPEGRWFTGFITMADFVNVVELTGGWRFCDGKTSGDTLGRNTAWLEAWFDAA